MFIKLLHINHSLLRADERDQINTVIAKMLARNPAFNDCPHACAGIDMLADLSIGRSIEMSVEVLVMEVRATKTVDTLADGALNVGIDVLLYEENNGVTVLELIVPAGAVTIVGVSIGAGPNIDVLLDALFDMLTSADVIMLAVVMTASEFILLSVSLEESLLSCCAPCSCWSMTVLDCDRALQAWKPSDHL